MTKHGSRVFDDEGEVPTISEGWQFGHSVYKCSECNTRRPFGFGVPERDNALLHCKLCNEATWHTYLGTSNGRTG